MGYHKGTRHTKAITHIINKTYKNSIEAEQIFINITF